MSDDLDPWSIRTRKREVWMGAKLARDLRDLALGWCGCLIGVLCLPVAFFFVLTLGVLAGAVSVVQAVRR